MPVVRRVVVLARCYQFSEKDTTSVESTQEKKSRSMSKMIGEDCHSANLSSRQRWVRRAKSYCPIPLGDGSDRTWRCLSAQSHWAAPQWGENWKGTRRPNHMHLHRAGDRSLWSSTTAFHRFDRSSHCRFQTPECNHHSHKGKNEANLREVPEFHIFFPNCPLVIFWSKECKMWLERTWSKPDNMVH